MARRIMRELKINEISGVDVPAQEGAKAVIMKRADVVEEKNEGMEFAKASALTTESEGHTHLIPLHGPPDGVELNAGHTSYVEGHTHPWIRDMDGNIVIGSARDMRGRVHAHKVATMSKDAPKKTETVGTEGANTMPDNLKAADSTVKNLEKQLEKANRLATLNDAEKAHYNALDDDAKKDAFLAKSADDRKAELGNIEKAKADSDPVVYTTMDGIKLRKSAGEALIAMAKSNDVLRQQNDELVEKAAMAALEKRAETELAHLPGTVQERAAMLKAIDGIKDEAQRTAALNALKAGNSAIKGAFQTVGHAARTPEAGSAESSLETLAQAYQKANPTVTYEQAYSEVLKTEEGRAAYSKSINANL